MHMELLPFCDLRFWMGCGFGPWFYQNKNFIVEVSTFVMVGMCLMCDDDVYLTMSIDECSIFIVCEIEVSDIPLSIREAQSHI